MPGPSEASGSRLLPPINTQLSRTRSRGRSESRTPNTGGPPSAIGTATSSRKVRTVPPSAIFEPTDPPSPPHTPIESDAQASTSKTQPKDTVGKGTTASSRRRPRPRLRYSTSSEGTSDDTSDSDDPPWWTFTNKGMNKLRNRTLGISSRGNSFSNAEHPNHVGESTGGKGSNNIGNGNGNGNDSAMESSNPENSRPRLRTRFASRKNSRMNSYLNSAHTDDEISRPRLKWKNSKHGSDRRSSNEAGQGSPSPSAFGPLGPDLNGGQNHSFNFFHRKSSTPSLAIPGISVTPSAIGDGISDNTHMNTRGGKGRKGSSGETGNQSDSGLVIRRVFKRSNSAPGSPIEDHHLINGPEPTLAGIISQSSPTFPGSNRVLSESPDNSIPPSPTINHDDSDQKRPTKRRQMTTPSLNRFRKNVGVKSNSMDPFLYRQSRDQDRVKGRNGEALNMSNDNMSDSEAHMSASPRVKAKVRILGSKLIHSTTPNLHNDNNDDDNDGNDEDEDGGEGETGTPNVDSNGNRRPRNKRLNSHMLRIQLPPRLDQHLHQWPHAGSWQDALYGYYEEDKNDSPSHHHQIRGGKRRNTRRMTDNKEEERKREKSGETLVYNGDSPIRGISGGQPQTPRIDNRGDTREGEVDGQGGEMRDSGAGGAGRAEVGYEEKKRERKKSRRSRKYRQALMPPTPQGLGFDSKTDNEEENDNNDNDNENLHNQMNPNGFDWNLNNNNNKYRNGNGTIIEHNDDDLSRTETRATSGNAPTEKSDSLGKSSTRRLRLVSTSMSARKKRRRLQLQKQEDEKRLGGRNGRGGGRGDWKVRWKRILFLDARLTILIRVVDLAVVASLLALAITIRLELQSLNLPGLIGSSTTITISFASFTLLHGITAIYREYFGKPIGLWALRSKMLWVCLDLLFVALWSSALSVAINDYISTPLGCSSDDPWWFKGLYASYQNLLNGLNNSEGVDNSDGGGITPVDFIKATLGIILPEQILQSGLAHQVCYRQRGTIALSLLSLLLYAGNMVLSLFRIFETVRRTANVSKAVGMV